MFCTHFCSHLVVEDDALGVVIGAARVARGLYTDFEEEDDPAVVFLEEEVEAGRVARELGSQSPMGDRSDHLKIS